MSRRFRPLFCGLLAAALAASEARAQLVLPGAGARRAARGDGHAQAEAPEARARPARAPRREARQARRRGRASPALPGARSCSTASRACCRFPATTRRRRSTSCSSPARASRTPRSAASSTSSARSRSRRRASAARTASSGSRPTFPPARSRFDVLDGAVLAPSQITACVFKAADCQTGPGGLWGPEGASLVGDAAKIAKERAEAEKAMGKILHAIQDRAEDSPEAADVVREQNALRRPARRALPRLRQGKRSRLLRLAPHRGAHRAFAGAARRAWPGNRRLQGGERKKQEDKVEEERQTALADIF